MKKLLIIMTIFLSASAAMAAKLPDGVYIWKEHEKAKKEALAEKRPLLYVLTELKTN